MSTKESQHGHQSGSKKDLDEAVSHSKGAGLSVGYHCHLIQPADLVRAMLDRKSLQLVGRFTQHTVCKFMQP